MLVLSLSRDLGRRRPLRTLGTACAIAALVVASAGAASADPLPTNPPVFTPPVFAAPISASLPAGGGMAPGEAASPPPAPFGAVPDAFDPTSSYAAQSATYTLRPGDVVSINVFGQPSFSEASARILPDGSVAMPLVGAVRIARLTPARAATAIDGALRQYLRAPRTTVSVLQVAPVAVLVLGAVRVPSKYLLQPQSRLMDAIAAAGGLAPIDGDLPDARIESGTATISTVSLQRLFHDSDLSLNRPIENGMTIYIPSPNTFQVQVLGAVDHSGDVTVREGDRLSMAIARAGVSSASNADLNRVFFKRYNADGTVSQQTIDLYEVLKNKDVASDPVLKKNDLVQIPKARSGSSASIAAQIFYPLSNLFPRI